MKKKLTCFRPIPGTRASESILPGEVDALTMLDLELRFNGEVFYPMPCLTKASSMTSPNGRSNRQVGEVTKGLAIIKYIFPPQLNFRPILVGPSCPDSVLMNCLSGVQKNISYLCLLCPSPPPPRSPLPPYPASAETLPPSPPPRAASSGLPFLTAPLPGRSSPPPPSPPPPPCSPSPPSLGSLHLRCQTHSLLHHVVHLLVDQPAL